MAIFQYFVLFYIFVSIKEMIGSFKKAPLTLKSSRDGTQGKKKVFPQLIATGRAGGGRWRGGMHPLASALIALC